MYTFKFQSHLQQLLSLSEAWCFAWQPKQQNKLDTRDGPWPDPTWGYFWPAVNKRLTSLWPSYFLTQPKEIIFDPDGIKLENLTFSGEIFKTQTLDGWPNLTRATKNWLDPGQKILIWTHHPFLEIVIKRVYSWSRHPY